jgi:hypothetical protein
MGKVVNRAQKKAIVENIESESEVKCNECEGSI